MQLSSPIVLSSEADEMALLCVSSEKVNAKKKKKILRKRQAGSIVVDLSLFLL